MVRYGHYIIEHQIPGWEKYYIGYKQLKKFISRHQGKGESILSSNEEERLQICKFFSEMLDSQMEKAVLFFLEQQGILAAELQLLREKRENLNDDVDEIQDLMEQYREVGRGLLRLLQFMEVNATALRKILKKFDKKVGLRLGKDYIYSRTNHPHSHIQQIFKQVGIGAMVGTILHNLQELHHQQTNMISSPIGNRATSFSLFRNVSVPAYVAENEPIIKDLERARAKLTHATSYSSFVATALLLPEPIEEARKEKEGEEEYHWWSLQLNLINTFFYMVNYYIIVPTSDEYATELNTPASVCGAIIGCMPLCALVSAIVYSSWSNRSYTRPLILSTIVLIIGNVFYAMALDLNSVWFLFLGRSLSGLGGARAINRRYIADHVPLHMRTSCSAAFVSASAVGMAAGPAMAAVLDLVDFKVWGFTVDYLTGPGWLMAVVWIIYLIFLLIFFKEPDKTNIQFAESDADVSIESIKGTHVRTGLEWKNPSSNASDLEASLLLVPDISKINEEMDEEEDDEDEKGRKGSDSIETLADLAKEMTPAVQVLLFIYFMNKFAVEVLISESSLVSKYFFGWTINDISLFLVVLGLTVLPISSVCGNYISNVYEDRLVILWTEILTGVGVVCVISYSPLIQYTQYQYVISAIIIFVAANCLEGVNMSLLSKIMSPKLARGTFNCGLLSTEAGTLARVIGDAIITLVGYLGDQWVLNLSMIPVLAVVTFTVLWTLKLYYILY